MGTTTNTRSMTTEVAADGTERTQSTLVDVRERLAWPVDALGETVRREFACCDTTFRLQATGWRATRALEAATERARTLEARLDAFADDSAVVELNRTGSVTDRHVAAVVRRGLDYRDRTDGAFDVTHGTFEHALKAYLRGDRSDPPAETEPGRVRVSGSTVTADAPVDLNGLAKGYIVDRAAATLLGVGRRGFVDGGGDLSGPTGPVAIESPYGDESPLTVLDTRWNVATSAGYNRQRGTIDHLYHPTSGERGSRHDLVTVVAERDCMAADALATAAATQPLEEALSLIDGWDGAEALVVHAGVFHRTVGFEDHVA